MPLGVQSNANKAADMLPIMWRREASGRAYLILHRIV